jgi:Family of unknown function (DUF5681)
MSNDKKKDYEVGYKKPPVATRFKKRESGNPSGRPKKAKQLVDPGIILASIDNEEIIVNDNRKRKRMTKAEIQIRQLFTKAIKGNLTVARLIVNMATEYSAAEEGGFYDTEVIGVTEAAQRFGRNWQNRIQQHNARFRD